MKYLPKLAMLILLWMPALGQVPGNVISRVVQIRYAGSTGTAFMLDHQPENYFVTAGHMVISAGDRAEIGVLSQNDNKWYNIPFRILHGAEPCADVAVLIPLIEIKSVKIDPLPMGVGANYYMGQEAFFLGFPYGLYSNFGNPSVAIPLIKHAYVSAVVSCSALNPKASPADTIILLDGMNNHGFSGGPVVVPDLDRPSRPMMLIGVISGYLNDPSPINSNGRDNPGVTASGNSGIVSVIPIEQVLTLIRNDDATNASKSTTRN